MSTRAIVAEPYGDTWRGRHTHSDGYPTGRGRHLWALVKRDGLEKVRQTMIHDYYGWSIVNAEQPDITGVTPPPDQDGPWRGDYGTAEYYAACFDPKSKNRGQYSDGRYVNVPGYGVAYTDAVLSGGVWGKSYQQVTEDSWVTQADTADTEWAYVLAKNGLWVFTCDDTKNPVGIFDWNWDEPVWQAIEDKVNEDWELAHAAQIGKGA